MGLTGGVIKWLIDRNQSKLNQMSKDSLEIDFALKYGYLEGLCTKTQYNQIKKIYKETEELKTELGQVYEITSAPSEKLAKRTELELFFNDIDRIIAKGKLDVAIRSIELNTQQKTNEAIKSMVRAREEFIQKCPEYLSMNISRMQNVKIFNDEISKIHRAYYENLDIYKQSPDYSQIKNKLDEIKDNMGLCVKDMYEYRGRGFDFSKQEKDQLYKRENELSVFGSQRIEGLKAIEEESVEQRREKVEEALKKREGIKELEKLTKSVDKVYEDIEVLANNRIPIRGSRATKSINKEMTR